VAKARQAARRKRTIASPPRSTRHDGGVDLTADVKNERRGLLADSYAAAVVLVVCALVPFLALTASMTPLVALIGKDVGLSRGTLELTIAVSDAAYAFGTVLAVQFAQHLRPRRMLLLYVAVFVTAAVVAAWAPTPGLFVVAFVLEGLCTSLMLIAAVPPLVVGWGAEKMPVTGTIMNLCIFGAVAAGPALGSFVAGRQDWRTLFWVVAGIAVVALVFALLTYDDEGPQNRDAPWDAVAVVLAGFGCSAAFFGAAKLEVHRHATTLALATLAAGIAAVVALVVHQYRIKRPLMPVKQLATTFPTIGVLIAITGSATAFGLMSLSLNALAKHDPKHVALLFLPELAAAVVTAGIFGALFRTRFTPVYAFAGLLVLCAAAIVLKGVAGGGDARVALGSGLLGLGVGAAVSPGLFIVGFSLSSKEIQRVFALVELLRGVGAFLFAPVLLYLVAILSPRQATATAGGAWICFGLAAGAAALAVVLFAGGHARLQRPDLETWQEEGEPAWESPPLPARRQRR
jgi:MFS family permease